MRKRTNLILTCNGTTVVSFQTKEQIETQVRKNNFLKFGGTAENYLFSLGVQKQIQQFKMNRI